MRRLYIHKMRWRLDREISDLLEEGRNRREINVGVKVTAACLGELATEGEKEAKQQQPI